MASAGKRGWERRRPAAAAAALHPAAAPPFIQLQPASMLHHTASIQTCHGWPARRCPTALAAVGHAVREPCPAIRTRPPPLPSAHAESPYSTPAKPQLQRGGAVPQQRGPRRPKLALCICALSGRLESGSAGPSWACALCPKFFCVQHVCLQCTVFTVGTCMFDAVLAHRATTPSSRRPGHAAGLGSL